jgi:hypothetical protein
MINLDDTQQLLLGLGGDKALQSVRGLPQQISSSLDDVLNVAFPSQYKHCSNIVFCGMGGSRFPGLVAYNLYKSEFRVPSKLDSKTNALLLLSKTILKCEQSDPVTFRIIHESGV